MHQTITCKLKSSEKDFSRQFYPQNCDCAIFVPKIYPWLASQFNFCKLSPYDQAKELNDFQFYYFPFKPEKTQMKIYAVLNHFSIWLAEYVFNILESVYAWS